MTRQKLTDEQRKAANLARQMRYRERHLQGEAAPLARVNCLIDAAAKAGIDRLSECFDVTQKWLIERLVKDAESAICDPLDAAALAGYQAGKGRYRAPMPECLFRSNGLSRNADEIEALRSSVIELKGALGIAQTHFDARQAVIDELSIQLQELRAAAAIETVSGTEGAAQSARFGQGSAKGNADDKAKKGGPWPAPVRAMAVRMKAEGAKLPAIAEAMSAAAGGRAPPDTSSLTPQLKRWAAKLG